MALREPTDDTVPMKAIGPGPAARGGSDTAQRPTTPRRARDPDDPDRRETLVLHRTELGLPASSPATHPAKTTGPRESDGPAEGDSPATSDQQAKSAPAGRAAARHATGRRPPSSSHRGAPARLLVVLARVGTTIGEALITLGVLIGLFLVYQLWWTNIEARHEQQDLAHQLDKQFTQQQAASHPGVPQPPPDNLAAGQPFAYIWIPALAKLGHPYVFVVMQDIGIEDVLNKGAVGHYMQTAMPGEVGNFATAAHRNTHGEPFRYINELQPGDQIVVETAQAYYVYTLDRELPQTSASDIAAIDPVPTQAGYTKPGQYLTLTTCTPEFTSWYRLIWWGHLTQTIPWSPTRPPLLNGLNRD